ncbi:GAF domain-containing sensor histidine kinase [Alteromonas gracilis]|uniref:GAF domain-containing sensor histidine kinase n=1 Tax=Alteromonas gracilis TaxID=1479524 RepID=UPI00321B491C
MSKDYENVLEDLALVYRLKEQAEAHKKESDALLAGTRALLTAKSEQELYQKMFGIFRDLYNYEVCFVLENDSKGKMRCTNSTYPPVLGSLWEVDETLSRAMKSSPVALFNIKMQPTWQQHLETFDIPVTSVLYCPFKVHSQHAVIVFCHHTLGYYTQEYVEMANRYRTFTEQMAMSVQAKLMALETVRLKEEKARVEKSLIDSEKMASLGLLAAGVAHEINNPIAFINSNIHFLKDTLPDLATMQNIVASLANSRTEEERLSLASTAAKWVSQNKLDSVSDEISDICTESQEGLQRVTEIITSLRSFSHDADIADDETVNVNDCIAHALRLVNSELKHRIEIVQCLENPPSIKGKTGKLNQILVNLFVNAAQAMEDGGTLTICSRHDKESNSTVVTVNDTGCGIEKHALQKLFEPFYTTKPTGKGTYLGLYISFSIVEAMGGTITVDSEVNVGTTFTLTFPSSAQ